MCLCGGVCLAHVGSQVADTPVLLIECQCSVIDCFHVWGPLWQVQRAEVLFEMLICKYKYNSTQCVLAVTLLLDKFSILNMLTPSLPHLFTLNLPFSITLFLVASVYEALIQNIHSKASTFSHIFSLFAYEFCSETPTYSCSFVGIQISRRWMWFTLSPPSHPGRRFGWCWARAAGT